MGIIAETFGGYGRNVELLASAGGDPNQLAVSDEATQPTYTLKEFETAYRKDPICFNSINRLDQMIMAAGYRWQDGDEKGKKKMIEFFDNMGRVGDDITFDEFLETLFRHQMIFGKEPVELVSDKETDTRILDIVGIDPKRIDYAKSADGKIAIDNYGKPIGYMYKLSYGHYAVGDVIPEEYKSLISLESNSIFILAKRIVNFKLYVVGDKFNGIGLIEPGYKSILRKMNIEEAQTNSIYSRGTFPVIASVGDERHEPTPQQIEKVLENLVKLNHKRYAAFQHWVKVAPLEVKQSDIVQTTLDYLRVNQVAPTGLPMSFATGMGEQTNRATLSNQQKMLEFAINDIVKKTMATFNKHLIKRIALANKIKNPPTLVWNWVSTEDDELTINQITKLLTNNVSINPILRKALEVELARLFGFDDILETMKKQKIEVPIPQVNPEQKPSENIQKIKNG